MTLKSQAGKELISFANRLDSDQAGQHVGSDLDPKCLSMHEKKIIEIVDFETNQ